eukprot:6041061-Prymnesium_polylepis.1
MTSSSIFPSCRGMKYGTNGSSSSGATEQTKKGVRKAHAASDTMSWSTPPITGPTMQPTPEMVPIDAITVPRRSCGGARAHTA